MNSIEVKIEYIVNWLRNYLKKSNMKGFIFGVSGGVDSALLAYILAKYFPNNSLACIMNIENSDDDVSDGLLVANSSKIKYEIIELENSYVELKNTLPNDIHILGNIKSRLRMLTLYAYAQKYNMLVLGTSNADEYYTGYFTKYGDSGCDLLPLINLIKEDIYSAAKFLKVPEKIVNKKPSAGLYKDQTDEGDLKVSYQEIDNFLLKKSIPNDKEKLINKLYNASTHKRELAVSPKRKGEIL